MARLVGKPAQRNARHAASIAMRQHGVPESTRRVLSARAQNLFKVRRERRQMVRGGAQEAQRTGGT
jgi:hypothetical protein